MTIWAPDLKRFPGPRYKAIADALLADVDEGRLLPGARLPTHRELADRLQVTVGTVTRAYAEAAERGLLEATVGRGTFVRDRRRGVPRMMDLQPPGMVDLALNRPTLGPQADALAATLAELSRRKTLDDCLGYSPSAGALAHRESGARFLRALGLDVSPDRVLVACGAQSALAAVVSALTEPGDRMVTEWLGYPGIHAVAHQCRLRVLGLPIDAEGLIPEAFEEACRTDKPRLLVCVPNHHNPTAAQMPEYRRQAIAEIARAHDVLVLEDDVYGFLVDERPPPLAALIPERCCYVSCTSKPLVPGLRIGYVAAPPALVTRIATAIRTSVWMAPPLMAEIASRWIDDGTAQRLMDWQKEEARARQAIAAAHLDRYRPMRHAGGFHLWLTLPDAWRVGPFVAALRDRGVAVAPSDAFVVGRAPAPQAIRICVTAPNDRGELDRAVGIVADLLDHPPEASLAAF